MKLLLPAIVATVFTVLLIACGAKAADPATSSDTTAAAETFEVTKTEAEWKSQLDEMQFHVLRNKGTERAFTGKYWDNHEDGVYLCAGCGQELYDSKDKFESGTGWPSYTRPAKPGALHSESDTTFGMTRTELMCGRCGGHLGHVFTDGPAPTGMRHCINSASLRFQPRNSTPADGSH